MFYSQESVKTKGQKRKKKKKNFETFLCEHIFKNHSHYILLKTTYKAKRCSTYLLCFPLKEKNTKYSMSPKLLMSFFFDFFSCCVNFLAHHPMLRGVKMPFGPKDIAKNVLNYLIRSPLKVTKGEKKKCRLRVLHIWKVLGHVQSASWKTFFLKLGCKRHI